MTYDDTSESQRIIPFYLRRRIQIYVLPKRFDNEEKSPFFHGVRGDCRPRFRAGPGPCRYQRGDQPHDLVFRSRHQTVLCHRCGARPGGRHQDLRQVLQR